MYLLDSNALSEIRRVFKGNANVNFTSWFDTIVIDDCFINTIILLEQKKWALSKQHKNDKQQALILQTWLEYVLLNFNGRIFPITNEIAFTCAELHIPNPRPQFDSLIASTALVHDLTLVTRNTKDFADIAGLRIFNPFG